MVRKMPTEIIRARVTALKEMYLTILEKAVEARLSSEASIFVHHCSCSVKKTRLPSSELMKNGSLSDLYYLLRGRLWVHSPEISFLTNPDHGPEVAHWEVD